MFRRIHRWSAECSPNVRLARVQQAAGKVPTGETLVPGVLTWAEYQERRATWDKIRQTVGLDAQFYVGAEVLLFPPSWLARCRQLADNGWRRANGLAAIPDKRTALGVGVDPAEGGDQTALAAVDEWGLVELTSERTPDTSVVVGKVIAFAQKHQCRKVCFDRGGGGKEHADRIRAMNLGLEITTVGFGETPRLDLKRGLHQLTERKDVLEEKYSYKTLATQMFHELSQRMELNEDGANLTPGFAIPSGARYDELCRQLSVYQKLTDEVGRYLLPPKHKRDAKDQRKTLTDMLGRSPDEADAVVLAWHVMTHKPTRVMATVF